MRLALIIQCVILLVNTVLGERTSGDDSESNQLSSSLHQWTVMNFNGRIYPTIDKLNHLSLQDLLAIRPTKLRGLERVHFDMLFGLHPRIRPLSLALMSKENFIQNWVDVWTEETTGTEQGKLPSSIKTRLEKDPLVSDEVKMEVIRRHLKLLSDLSAARKREKRRTLKNPAFFEQRQTELENFRSRKAEKREVLFEDKRVKNALRFERLLKMNGISTTYLADRIERNSRGLRDRLTSAQQTTFCLRAYFNVRNPKEEGIKQALTDSENIILDGLGKDGMKSEGIELPFRSTELRRVKPKWITM